MNITLLLMLAVPVLGAALVYYFAPREARLTASGIGLVVGLLVVGVVFGVSYGAAVQDVEIWSGKVISKERKHGEYEESYKCNCRSVTKTRSNGSSYSEEECDTCYRTHYTVHWNCHTTIGSYTIDSLDRLSRSVYNAPNPHRWLIIKPNDPVSGRKFYTNYVQAVSNSLFAAADENLMNGFGPLLVEYPDKVYDFYHVDRFVSPGFSFTDAKAWNDDISKMLIDLGPAKQVNVVIAVAKTGDRAYTSALRTKWEGANKNDVVLVIGSLDGQKMEFVDVITWSKNEIFKVQLIDRIQSIGIISRPQIIEVLQSQIAKNFERRRMREFEYLKGEIDPSSTTIAVTIAILVIGYGAGIMLVTGKLDALINRRLARPRRRF
jgi:hypothetical protein